MAENNLRFMMDLSGPMAANQALPRSMMWGTVRVATGSLGLQGPLTVKECLSNQAVPTAEKGWKIRLQAQEAQVYCLGGR